MATEKLHSDLAIWCGPVTAANLKTVIWQRPCSVHVENEGLDGIGSAAFDRLGRSLGSPVVSALAARAKWTGPGRIGALGFSAAHGLLRHVCADGGLDSVAALGAFDAWYGSGADEGYFRAADRAADGGMLCVFTASDSPDPNVGSCWTWAGRLRDRYDMRPIGAAEMGIPSEWLAGAQAWQRGALYLAHVPAAAHVKHATSIAPAVCSRLVAPRLAGGSSLVDPVGDPGLFGELDAKRRELGLSWFAIAYVAWRVIFDKGGR